MEGRELRIKRKEGSREVDEIMTFLSPYLWRDSLCREGHVWTDREFCNTSSPRGTEQREIFSPEENCDLLVSRLGEVLDDTGVKCSGGTQELL